VKARALSSGEPSPLTDSEEITLRRVAYGQSDVAHLRAADLDRLRALKLIDGSSRVPALTAAGKTRFDALAKPVAIAEFNAQNELMAVLGRLMAKKPAQ
jgi:hypothetical protein